MELIDHSYGIFEVIYRDGGDTWHLAIYPVKYRGIKPSDNYFIYCIHPLRGSLAFIVQQGKNYDWIGENRTQCISKEFIH